jgi:hypothetical protein
LFGPGRRLGKREARCLAGSCNKTVHYPVNTGDMLAPGDGFAMMAPLFNGHSWECDRWCAVSPTMNTPICVRFMKNMARSS